MGESQIDNLKFQSLLSNEEIESNFKEMDFFGELMNGLTEALEYSKEEPLQKPFIRNSSPQKDV